MNIDTVRLIALLALLAVAVLIDVRTHKIPNNFIILGVLIGISSSALPGGIGFVDAIGGLALGGAMMMPLYALRAMGAGDVKLMACAGTLMGIKATFVAAMYAFAIGGALAILFSMYLGTLAQTLSNLKAFIFHSLVRAAGKELPHAIDMPGTQARMPYSLAIAGGVGVYVAGRFYSAGVFG